MEAVFNCFLRIAVLSSFLCFVLSDSVDEQAWIAFKSGVSANKHSSNVFYDCPVAHACRSLNREVITCDSAEHDTACGKCMAQYHLDRERGLCVKDSFDDVQQLFVKEEVPVVARSAEDVDSSTTTTNSGKLKNHPTAASVVQSAPANPQHSDKIFYAVISLSCALGLLAVVIAVVCFYNYHRKEDIKLKAYYTTPGKGVNKHGFLGPVVPGDRKLAKSAQMYHYQHQKQQMLAKASNGDLDSAELSSLDGSDVEVENGADFTVYECPGLASGEDLASVDNPLFTDQLSSGSLNK